MNKISNPKIIAEVIRTVFNRPLTENEILMRIVEIIKPEFLITLWN